MQRPAVSVPPSDGGTHRRFGRFTVSPQHAEAENTAASLAAAAAVVDVPGGLDQRQPSGSGATIAADGGGAVEEAAEREQRAAAAAAAVSAEPPPAAAGTAVDQPEQATKLQSLHQLQAILDTQHTLFTKTWEDMKEQVYRALLQKDSSHPPQQASRPTTPTSTHSASSSRTPPIMGERPASGGGSGGGGSGGGSGGGGRAPAQASAPGGPTSAVATAGPAAAGHSQGESIARENTLQPSLLRAAGSPMCPSQGETNARENTLQMWSHLGSTLREVVNRNDHLELENGRLRQDLQKLQQRIKDARQAFAPCAPPAPSSLGNIFGPLASPGGECGELGQAQLGAKRAVQLREAPLETSPAAAVAGASGGGRGGVSGGAPTTLEGEEMQAVEPA